MLRIKARHVQSGLRDRDTFNLQIKFFAAYQFLLYHGSSLDLCPVCERNFASTRRNLGISELWISFNRCDLSHFVPEQLHLVVFYLVVVEYLARLHR